jgi:hypothetical protein
MKQSLLILLLAIACGLIAFDHLFLLPSRTHAAAKRLVRVQPFVMTYPTRFSELSIDGEVLGFSCTGVPSEKAINSTQPDCFVLTATQ